MSARNLEPCFVPTFLPSNMTDEEFLNMIDEALPRCIVERFREILTLREEVETSERAADDVREEGNRTVTLAREKCETLRERWDGLCENHPEWDPEGRAPGDVGLVASSLDALEEILA